VRLFVSQITPASVGNCLLFFHFSKVYISQSVLLSAVLAHFGNELRLDLSSASTDSADVSGPQINVTRRVVSSKVADEKRPAKCADRKYTGHYAFVAPASDSETRQPVDYIKMNIRKAGRPPRQ
jgi:hypothetical protein